MFSELGIGRGIQARIWNRSHCEPVIMASVMNNRELHKELDATCVIKVPNSECIMPESLITNEEFTWNPIVIANIVNQESTLLESPVIGNPRHLESPWNRKVIRNFLQFHM